MTPGSRLTRLEILHVHVIPLLPTRPARWTKLRDRFLERPGKFSGAKANFKITTCWIVAQFLAHKPFNFVSLTDSFIVLFSKLLDFWSWMQTQKSFPGPKRFRDFREADRSSEKNYSYVIPILSVLKFGVLASPLHVQNTRTKVTARQGELELFV